MSIFEAIFLGVVQGLTEFLPVSSSGHLVLFRQVFGVQAPPLAFDTAVHVGTLVAVFAVLWKDILALLKKVVQPLTLYLIIGTIPGVVAAFMFRDWLEGAFETGNYVGFAFLGTSLLLVTAELLAKWVAKHSPRKPGEMNWLDALIIGVCQAIALIPGMSRSGATLSGALSRGLNRDLAVRYSFMLSIPIILGATLFQLAEYLLGSGPTATEPVEAQIGPLAIAVGTVVATITGFFAVKLMLKIVRKKPLWGFAIYTGILGVLVLTDQLLFNLVF